jgi:hypothetical protein
MREMFGALIPARVCGGLANWVARRPDGTGCSEKPTLDLDGPSAHEARLDVEAHDIDKAQERGETRAVKGSESDRRISPAGFHRAGRRNNFRPSHAPAYFLRVQ